MSQKQWTCPSIIIYYKFFPPYILSYIKLNDKYLNMAHSYIPYWDKVLHKKVHQFPLIRTSTFQSEDAVVSCYTARDLRLFESKGLGGENDNVRLISTNVKPWEKGRITERTFSISDIYSHRHLLKTHFLGA